MTASPPSWLPGTVVVSGVWKQVVAMLYGIFDTDFKKGRPTFQGMPTWWDRRILPGEAYEKAFWHLITRFDRFTNERVPDFRRAERLPWCAPTIVNSADLAVVVWDYEEGNGRVRTYLWLKDHDYVVILEKSVKRVGAVAFLVTAFHLDGESRRRAMKRKYDDRRVKNAIAAPKDGDRSPSARGR